MFIYRSLKKCSLIFSMLFIMFLLGCNIQNNNKDFEEWGKTMLNEYSGTEYTKSLKHTK